MPKLRLRDLTSEDLSGVTAVVRADLNAPLDGSTVTDDARLRASAPTILLLLQSGARVVLLSHLGRPGGRREDRYSLGPVASRLAELVGEPVDLVELSSASSQRPDTTARVTLVENTRFEPGEVTNDPALARAYADLGSIFVNDAFGAAHRAHASTEGVARVVRERGQVAVAGLLMERELEVLSESLESPERPFVAIVGGAKISGKIDVIDALLEKVDRLLIGGAMANTFFRALGLDTGESLVEEDRIAVARRILEVGGDRLLLPVDAVVTEEVSEGGAADVAERTAVRGTLKIVDIGPGSRACFQREIEGAATVLWNGPMGVFELPPYDAGTVAIARSVARATDGGALTIVGGGDSVAAVEVAGVAERVSHISTGGGAALELLAGKELPAVAALTDR